MEASLRWDVDDDGIIDNSGFPDQTYDAWSVVGARLVNLYRSIQVNLLLISVQKAIYKCISGS